MRAFDFERSNILLTGGTGGIGRGILKALISKNPKRIIVPGSNIERLDQLDSHFSSFQLSTIHVDFSDGDGVAVLISELKKLLPAGEYLDLVFFNAGTLGLDGEEEYPTWKNAMRCMAVNAMVPEFCFRAFVSEKLVRPGSCVIGAGSIAGHRSYADSKHISPYCISKSAMHRAIMNWAIDYSEMTIFELAYGAVDTKMLSQCRPKGMSDQEWHDLLMHDIPIKEVVKPSELGETIIQLLCSPGYRLFHGDTVYLSGGERNA